MRVLIALIAAALLAAPCSLAAGSPLALTGRLAKTGDLNGFAAPPKLGLSVYKTAAEWAKGFPDPAAETKRLQKLGFVGAAFEHLTATHLLNRDAVSVVIQFRTPAGARANLANAIVSYGNGRLRVTHFTVPGVPGATGLYAHRSDGAGYDAVFTDGVYFYDVGAYSPSSKASPTSAQVAAAAAALYHRVHGH
jgi:hypothetical protein